MKRFVVGVSLIMALLGGINCDESGDHIISSRDHDIKTAQATQPSILANGISTTEITATVINKNKTAAPNMRVHFKTTHGTIDEQAVTDANGIARATLTSEASEQDIIAAVTAIVVDTVLTPLNKAMNGPFQVELQVTGFEAKTRALRKNARQQDSEATIYVKFLGVTLSAEIEETVLPADGTSETDVMVKLRETTNLKVITNAEIRLLLTHGTIKSIIQTDDQGIATTALRAAKKATIDTLVIEYGNKITRKLGINFVIPKLELNPKKARILADGESKVQMIAILLTQQNNPIPGAKIKFSTSAGIIAESALTDELGQAKANLISAREPDSSVKVIARFLTLRDSASISFGAVDVRSITMQSSDEPLLRDGISKKTVTVYAKNLLGLPVENTAINLKTDVGSVPETIVTDQQGKATFEYVADAGITDITATITANVGSIQAFQQIKLLGVTINISATPDSIPADGKSTSSVRVELKQTSSHVAIGKYPLTFSTNLGTIPVNALTDDQGVAVTTFTSSVTAGTASVKVNCGLLNKTVTIYLFDNYPNSILLTAEPNFIWVKETGHIQQSILTATVLGVTGQPVHDNYGIKFKIINSPGGGVKIEPSSGSNLETTIIRTVSGKAEAKVLAGTISGTVQIRAELVDYPQVAAQTTNLIIRSGPPYMWVNPANANDVIPHATLAIENGKHNVAFGNPIQDIKISGYFGDKYNNPVEEGTAVYFTTTGGFITSDGLTNNKGQTNVILQNVNPFPVLASPDSNQLTALNIPNPNDDTLKLKLTIPDFEGGLVFNSKGTFLENDGIAVLLAYTWGQDQNGHPIKVWATGQVVYSVGVLVFDIRSDSTELRVGNSSTIRIRLYDANGNPVAAGSSLTVSTTAGELSETNLMPPAERYGYGQTSYQVSLTNNLDPTKDKETTATVKVKLDSPNGTGSRSVNIKLKIN